MKVTYITASNIPSKYANSIHSMKMAHGFKQIGCDVRLISASSFMDWLRGVPSDLWYRYGISGKYKFTRLPFRLLVENEIRFDLGRISFGYFASLYSKYSKTDFVYSRDYLAPYWSVRMGIPTIVEMHGFPTDDYRKQKLFKISKQNALRGFVTISEELAEKYIKAGVPDNKIIIEQDGVDLSVYSKMSESEVAQTRSNLLGEYKAIALYAGSLWEHKGIPLVFDAARKLPDISFVLVGGWDKDIRCINKKIKDEGIKNIKLTGFVSNFKVPVYLKAADLLLLPNSANHEQASSTSPIKLFEYMAAGRPIVATSIKNVLNVLKNRHNAVLCEPDDPQGFVKCIEFLISNKNKADELAGQSQEDVIQYEWKQRCKRILNKVV